MRRVTLLLGGLLLLSNLASAQIGITFQADAAVASGITSGGDVVWFGVSRDRGEWLDHFYHWRRAAKDDDVDSAVSYSREGGFPELTVLMVVDLTRGDFAVATSNPREVTFPPLDLGGAQAAPDGTLISLQQPGSQLDVLVVRPSSGVWGSTVLDGGPLDLDFVADGTVTIGFSRLRPMGGKSAALDGVRAGDIVAVGNVKVPWVQAVRVAADGGEE